MSSFFNSFPSSKIKFHGEAQVLVFNKKKQQKKANKTSKQVRI